MNLKASLLYAKSLIFPKSDKNSSARRSMAGALICIGLSLVPMIVVLTVSNGMINGMTERIIGLSSGHVEAFIANNQFEVRTAENFEKFADRMKNIEGVVESYPEITLNALIGGKSERAGAQIRAMQADIFEQNQAFKNLFTVTEGELSSFENGQKKAVIGQKLAETLNLHTGDTFRIITTKKLGKTVTPKLTSFSVAAVITSGYQELDALWVFIPLDTAYTFIPLNTSDFRLIINLDNPFSPLVEKVRQEVEEASHGIANVYTWAEVNQAKFENFSSTRVMLVFVMILIVLVASVNISSAIVMLVMERRKEIAILKCIGATPRGVTFAFLLTGLSCGIGGVVVGVPVGLLLAVNSNQIVRAAESVMNWFSKVWNLTRGIPLSEISEIKLMDPAYYLAEIPINIPFAQVLGIVMATLILSVVVSIIPSHKAGLEKPNEIFTKN